MPRHFIHETVGGRVLFGAGSLADVADEALRLGDRVFVICDQIASATADSIEAALGEHAVGRIEGVSQHVPVAEAEAARERVRDVAADTLLAVGGGSTVGLAKAIALTDRLPILAVPTTYAGSEVTPVWGMTEDDVKTTGRDPVVAPRTVVYDPELTYTLPSSITAASGLNAVAHCADALWSPARTPLTDAMAERGIASLAEGLRGAVRDGRDAEARELAQIGAWLAGATFAVTGSSIHHKLCHFLGGRYGLPHAEMHAALLPWVAEFVLPTVPSAGAAIGRALGATDPVAALRGLNDDFGAPTNLGALGLDDDQARDAADEIDLDALAAPRPVTREELRALMARATAGT